MAIKEVLELVGSDVVIKQLDAVQKKGEDTLASFNKPLPELKFPESPQIDATPVKQFTEHTVKLSEAFHVLRPIMQAIGIQFSEFGAFSRLAGASLTGLGVAVIGAAAVGIAKLEENLATLKGRLADLTGSTGGGEAAFKRLNDSAKLLGTTTEALLPSFESLKRGLDTFAQSTQGFKFVALRPEDLPQPRSIEAIASATENFFKILRAGRLDSAQATKASDDFFNSLKQAGKLTADALDKLPSGTVQLLAQALGRGAISVAQFTAEVSKAPIPIDKVATALSKFGPQADAAFKTNAIIGMSDALNGLLNTFNDIAQKLTGLKLGDVIGQQITALGAGIKQTVDQITSLITKLKEAAAFKIAGVPLFTITIDEKTNQDAEKAGGTAAERFAKGFRDAPGAAKVDASELITIEPGGLAEKAGQAAQGVLEEFNKRFAAGAPEVLAPLTRVPPFDLSNALASFQTGMEQLVTFAQTTFERIKQIFSQPIPLNIQGQIGDISGVPFASGGVVRGPGSTTSDSILAWLSNKEFVVNAKAVAHYGPDFFAALNAMRLPLNVGQFNMGGLARVLGNKFAGGGAVSSAGNRSLTLVLDQKQFSLTGSKGTIDDLEREASLRGLAMIGKAPSWIR